MKTVTSINEKGGVGKTTTCIELGGEAIRQGMNVLFIDGDPQATLTKALGFTEEPRIYDLIGRNAKWLDMLQPVNPKMFTRASDSNVGRVFCLTGNDETRFIGQKVSDERVLRFRLREVQDRFDLVIIDTSPSPSLFHALLLFASTHTIFPTEPEAWAAVDSINKIVPRAHDLHQRGKSANVQVAQPVAIVPTKFRSSTVLHNKVLTQLKKEYKGLVLDPIPLAVAVGEAHALRTSVYSLEGAESFSVQKHIHRVTNIILGRMGLKQPVKEINIG